MGRPLPTLPRGPRRRRVADGDGGSRVLLLTCPRVSPEWEFNALRVLMKPHDWTRGALEHRSGEQHWPTAAAPIVEGITRDVAERLSVNPPPRVHFPAQGEAWTVIEVTEPAGGEALLRGLAAVLSKRLPGLWFTADRLYARDGRFFRRKRDGTYKLRLVPAASVHLPRPVRAAIRGLS